MVFAWAKRGEWEGEREGERGERGGGERGTGERDGSVCWNIGKFVKLGKEPLLFRCSLFFFVEGNKAVNSLGEAPRVGERECNELALCKSI